MIWMKIDISVVLPLNNCCRILQYFRFQRNVFGFAYLIINFCTCFCIFCKIPYNDFIEYVMMLVILKSQII